MTTILTTKSLYCTWAHRRLLSPSLKRRFGDLDDFIRQIIASASSRLLIVSPFLSPTGLTSLQSSLAVAVGRGAWIRFITGELGEADGLNRRALSKLVEGEDGARIKTRIRILGSSDLTPVFLHAKIIVADGKRGYLGSANLSYGGLEKNLEVGTSLSEDQAEALDDLVTMLESTGFLSDLTASLVAR